MAETTDWTQDLVETPKKRKVPSWVLWTCGGCCLGSVIIGGVLTLVIWRGAREMLDPEKQWPRLERLIAFDTRPAELELETGTPPLVGFLVDVFVLRDTERELLATITHLKSGSQRDLDQMFEERLAGAPFGFGNPVEPELGELELQGRLVRVLRFRGLKGQGMNPNSGAGIRIDLSAADGKRVVVELQRIGSSERIDDALLQEFFAGFDVWRHRQ
jgi:hypothetical protein